MISFFKAKYLFSFHSDYDTGYGDIEFGNPQNYFVVKTENISRLSIPEGGNYPKELYFTSVYYERSIYETTHRFNYMLEWKDGTGRYQIANTSYQFNYEGAPNEGYFYINDFARGGKIEGTPYEPQREGYTFGGWYKEPECVNKWDFETDKLPEATYDEEGYITDFVETKLYAAWIKN